MDVNCNQIWLQPNQLSTCLPLSPEFHGFPPKWLFLPKTRAEIAGQNNLSVLRFSIKPNFCKKTEDFAWKCIFSLNPNFSQFFSVSYLYSSSSQNLSTQWV